MISPGDIYVYGDPIYAVELIVGVFEGKVAFIHVQDRDGRHDVRFYVSKVNSTKAETTLFFGWKKL